MRERSGSHVRRTHNVRERHRPSSPPVLLSRPSRVAAPGTEGSPCPYTSGDPSPLSVNRPGRMVSSSGSTSAAGRGDAADGSGVPASDMVVQPPELPGLPFANSETGFCKNKRAVQGRRISCDIYDSLVEEKYLL